MLVQVVVLLVLGVLGTSIPLQKECFRTLVGSIIQELLHDMKRLNLSAVPSLVMVNATVERCMHSHLKTFASTLKTLKDSGPTAIKLDKLKNCTDFIPKDLDKECKTAQVTGGDFLDALERFLRLLFQTIQMPE